MEVLGSWGGGGLSQPQPVCGLHLKSQSGRVPVKAFCSCLFKAAIFFCIYIYGIIIIFFKPTAVFEKVAEHKKREGCDCDEVPRNCAHRTEGGLDLCSFWLKSPNCQLCDWLILLYCAKEIYNSNLSSVLMKSFFLLLLWF